LSWSAVQHRDLYWSEVWHGLLLLMLEPDLLLAELLGVRALIIF
jgi:hypothetical protein